VAGPNTAAQKGSASFDVGLTAWPYVSAYARFLTSSLSQVSADDHAASAASLSVEIGFVEHASTIAKLCADDANEAHGTFCCNASVCSFCVPLIGSAAIARATAGEGVALLPDEVHPGLAPSPGFRPPSPSTNI